MIWINILNEIFLYFSLKEAPMAKHNSKAAGKLAETAKESALLRMLRIDGSQNGATLRTRIVRDKTKYNRNVKHKKSFADARDFAFYRVIVLQMERGCSLYLLRQGSSCIHRILRGYLC